MASRVAVAKAMAVLGATFPRDVTPELVAIYSGALQDVDDATLERAVGRAVAECRFFPVPAELRELAGANRPVVVDPQPILERIRGMAGYLPSIGETWPSVEDVRQKLGHGIGEAYSLAGARRLFVGNETGRDIALREFSAALQDVARVHGPDALALPPVVARKALPAPAEGSGGPPGRLGRIEGEGADWRALLGQPKQGGE